MSVAPEARFRVPAIVEFWEYPAGVTSVEPASKESEPPLAMSRLASVDNRPDEAFNTSSEPPDAIERMAPLAIVLTVSGCVTVNV
jgi:hypothetical protein